MQWTAEIAGFGLTAIKSRGESSQHKNDFSQNECSNTVHCLIVIHQPCQYSRAGISHLFTSKLHTSIETP